jgi:hypothetical protein
LDRGNEPSTIQGPYQASLRNEQKQFEGDR